MGDKKVEAEVRFDLFSSKHLKNALKNSLSEEDTNQDCIPIVKKHSTDEVLEQDARDFCQGEDQVKSKQKERDAAHIQLLMITTPDESAEAKNKEMIQEWLDNIEIKIKSQHPDGEVTVSSDLNSLLTNTLVLRLNCKSGKKKSRRATLSQSSSIEKEVTVTIDAAPKEQVMDKRNKLRLLNH